jgi:hypothetical protein
MMAWFAHAEKDKISGNRALEQVDCKMLFMVGRFERSLAREAVGNGV